MSRAQYNDTGRVLTGYWVAANDSPRNNAGNMLVLEGRHNATHAMPCHAMPCHTHPRNRNTDT